MKVLLLLTTLLILTNLSNALDCDACYRKCKWYKLKCKLKKAHCKVAAAAFRAFTGSVEALCRLDSKKNHARDRVNEAKDELVKKGWFRKSEFDGVAIHFCGALGKTSGMAPDNDKVLIHPDFRSKHSFESFVVLLAHEMQHIRQYRRWKTKGFGCRYMRQVWKGNGTGTKNSVEKECYNFGDQVAQCIYNNIGCPSSSRRRLGSNSSLTLGELKEEKDEKKSAVEEYNDPGLAFLDEEKYQHMEFSFEDLYTQEEPDDDENEPMTPANDNPVPEDDTWEDIDEEIGIFDFMEAHRKKQNKEDPKLSHERRPRSNSN